MYNVKWGFSHEYGSHRCLFFLQARRALRALRGLVRLKSLIEGQSVKRQAATTLRCMQTLARVQSQIRARRMRMSEENQALQRQLQQKHEKELEKFRVSLSNLFACLCQINSNRKLVLLLMFFGKWSNLKYKNSVAFVLKMNFPPEITVLAWILKNPVWE